MSDLFCIIEEDEKTFDYLTKYVTNCHNETETRILDNTLHIIEMQQHILSKCIPDEHANHEALNWVEDNGVRFRLYLNSIKILWVSHILLRGPAAKLTFEEFKVMKQNYIFAKPILSTVGV